MRSLLLTARPRLPLYGRAHSAVMALEMLSPSLLETPSLVGTSSLLAFADQGGNLAGKFFQASLLPYLGFLYFLSYPQNNTPKTANFGFQFLLFFVLSTVFTGIVTKSVYSSSLADVDWLHGAAETLLTTSNIYVVLGFRAANADPNDESPVLRAPAYLLGALVVALTALGPNVLGLNVHDPFLGGIGALPVDAVADALPHMEPINALSIPTWWVHFSSVFEFIVAMSLVWQYAETSGNERWKGLTWGMLPLHASGIAACTYHFFYNSQDLAFLVALQAGLTLLGNSTLCLATLRIALSNGWKPSLLIPEALRSGDNPAEEASAPRTMTATQVTPLPLLVAKVVLGSLAASFAMKYGELALDLPFEPNAVVALALVLGIPALVARGYLPAAEVEQA